MAMSGVGSGHRQQSSNNNVGKSMTSSSGSLLLSPPSSRSFPFRDGSTYLESALLVPYDDEGSSSSTVVAASASSVQELGATTSGIRESFALPLGTSSQAVTTFEQQQLSSSSYNFGPLFPVSASVPPLPTSVSNVSGPNFCGSDSQLGPPFIHQFSMQPQAPPFNVLSSGGTIDASINNPPPPTQRYKSPPPTGISPATDYFNPYSSSSPVLSTNNALPPTPATAVDILSTANPYARSAVVGQRIPSSQMTTAGQPNPFVPSAPIDDVTVPTENQWPPPPPAMTVLQEPAQILYVPVHPHWFYCKEVEKKLVWFPFSLLDSVHLEEVHNRVDNQVQDGQSMIVATDGGRYDVYVHDRVRCAVYWDEEPMAVRRATWFYRLDGDRAFLPYEEHFSEKLEEEYSVAVTTNIFHRRLEFPEGQTVVIHSPQVIVHYKPVNTVDWESATESQMKPRIVRRGMDDAEIVEDGEAIEINHLVFVVHGIGAICDLKFRTLPEAVGDFRMIANSLLMSHFRNHVESGRVGRVEFLPVSWHNFLHLGIDDKLKPITLKSIPKLRYFANDTILDVLFYTSPVYAQAIINQVSSEINRIYQLFRRRNPNFSGNVSLAGHSLGSVILFDLLYHQPASTTSRERSVDESDRSSMELRSPTPSVPEQMPSSDTFLAAYDADSGTSDVAKPPLSLEEALQQLGLEEYMDVFNKENMDLDALRLCGEDDLKDIGIPLGPRKKFLALLRDMQLNNAQQACGDLAAHSLAAAHVDTANPGRRRKPSETMIHYVVGIAGTGHPCVIYPRLDFQSTCFFAIGSPVAMFLTIRGHDTVWDSYKLPNCPAYYNIFHPFDPVAYRMEPLIDPALATTRPVLVPHHKGRKRMHLEIKESLSRVGADLKQKVVESLRSTWNTINDFARAHRASNTQVEAEVDNMLEDENRHSRRKSSQIDDDLNIGAQFSIQDQGEEDFTVGQLNGGRRIDYVLQEKPIESFNEYLFALQSHTCYWESEDTVLLMLKEIYSSYGIHPSFQVHDSQTKQLPQPPSNSHMVPTFNQRQTSTTPLGGGGGWDSRPSSTSFEEFTTTSAVSSIKSDYDIPSAAQAVVGMDPTAPPSTSYVSTNSGISTAPPPLSGFVKQSVFRK